MTVDQLIERLEIMRDQIGGDCEVVVVKTCYEGKELPEIVLKRRGFDDPKSETGRNSKVLIYAA